LHASIDVTVDPRPCNGAPPLHGFGAPRLGAAPPAHPSQSAKFFHQVLIRYYNPKIENTEKIRKDPKIKKQFESGKLGLIAYLLDPMAQNL
jgi:hypothetical protein